MGLCAQYRELKYGDQMQCRLLEPIGNIPPDDAEAAYYTQLEMTRIAA